MNKEKLKVIIMGGIAVEIISLGLNTAIADGFNKINNGDVKYEIR